MVIIVALKDNKPVAFRQVPDGLAAVPVAEEMHRDGREVIMANVFQRMIGDGDANRQF